MTEEGEKDKIATVPGVQVAAQKLRDRALKEIGPSKAVERFIDAYGKVRVQALLATRLLVYFRWLKQAGVSTMTPDELVVDNLRCFFKSEAEDVATFPIVLQSI